MSTNDAVAKFNEIFETMKKYMDTISQIKDFSYIVVEATIDMYHLGARKTQSLTLEKLVYKDSPVMLYYKNDQYDFTYRGNNDKYVDERWKCSDPVDDTYCPIIETFEHAAILNVSYNVTCSTPSNHMLEARSKRQPQHLIVMLWRHINRTHNFHCASIYRDDQGGASIYFEDGKYECTLRGSTLKSMRDLRDYLDGAKISITMTDGSREYGYVNDLYCDNILALADEFTETVDGGTVEWKNGKWCDPEYVSAH